MKKIIVGPTNATKYRLTEEEHDYIFSNWPDYTDRELLERFNRKFSAGMTFGWLRQYKAEHGFVQQEQVKWTEEEVEFLLENYRHIGDLEIADILGIEGSSSKLRSKRVWKKRQYLGLKRTKSESVQIHHNNVAFPDGHRWELANGNQFIKVDGKCRYFRRWLWEQHYGPIPEGMCVVNRDGNLRNCDLDNLELVSRSELCSRVMANITSALGDNWIIGSLSKKAPEIKDLLRQQPALIELQRQRLLLNRQIKKVEKNGTNE